MFSHYYKRTMKVFYSFLLITIFNFSFSQENYKEKSGTDNKNLIDSIHQPFIDSVLTPLQNKALFFEKLFIHVNKTSYFIDDNIWFKAYVGDEDNKPSLKTTRLSINLLDSNGVIIQEKSVFINKGVGKGQFVLNDSLKSGTYYIQANTNYMRNFGDNNFCIQEINLINKNPIVKKKNKDYYDVQLFPEGGYLLEDAENILGLKALINNKGIDFTGKIINSKNQEIVSFKNQHLGMTKCKFIYSKNEKYTAVINLKDTIIKIAVPLAEKDGVILCVNNSESNFISIHLKTNSNTIHKLKKSNYKLLFHQRNRVLDFTEIGNLDTTTINLEIEKSTFYSGVNSITLFRDNQPILERKFYIEKESLETTASLKRVTIENDSIKYNLKIVNIDKPINANISISIFPKNILNYNEIENIKTSFQLSPYIKGYIENPAYYYDKKNLLRKEHLDLLLLTQGWTQYTLEGMITDLNPSYKYDFELGYKLTGTVNPLLSNYLTLISTENIIIDKLFLNSKKEFSFNNLLIYKGDIVKVAFLNNLNEVIKPENIDFTSVKKSTPLINFNIKDRSQIKNSINPTTSSWENTYYSEAINLNEVLVTKKKKNQNYIEKKKLIAKYEPLVFDIGKYYSLEIPDRYKNEDLITFLEKDQNTRLVNWNGVENYLSVGGSREAALYVNGKRVTSGELSSLSLSISSIENIMMQPIKGNIIYQIFTNENYNNNIVELFNEYVFNYGFDKEKKYYTPIFEFDITKNLTEIDWKSNIAIDKNGETFIKIKNYKELDGFLFSIQGFSENGLLISETLIEN